MNNPQRSLQRFLEHEADIETRRDTNIETDMDEIKWNIQFTEKLFPNCTLMLCNARHRNFKYISESCRDLLGYSTTQFHKIMQDNFFGIVHPDDAEGVSACFRYMIDSTSQNEDLTRLRFAMRYRALHANGHYINMIDEKIMLTSRNGKHIGFTMLKEDTSNFTFVKLEVSRQAGNSFVRVNEFIPNKQQQPVSSREYDVVRLIREGFNSKEIAGKLSLSIHTVKNHRKRLFKKMNVRNSLELVKVFNA